jgi:uncharacterized protein YcnI
MESRALPTSLCTLHAFISRMKNVILALLLVSAGTPAAAQVAINPVTTTPAAWERFALRVINQTDTPTVSVRLEVPAAVSLLGVEDKPGWTWEKAVMPDSGPTVVTWKGGSVKRGEFAEFPFLGRLKADARQEDLVFPVQIVRASGSAVEWRRGRGEDYAAPRVEVAGTVRISAAGQMVLAGTAIGIALLALVVAIARSAPKHPAR